MGAGLTLCFKRMRFWVQTAVAIATRERLPFTSSVDRLSQFALAPRRAREVAVRVGADHMSCLRLCNCSYPYSV